MRREFFGWAPSSRLNRIDSLVPARADQVNDKSVVRYWPKADMAKNAIDVAIGREADMPIAVQMSAYDPEL
jgi:hypothetical protein